MRIVTYQGEKTLSDLAHRLIPSKGRKGTQLAKAAESVLLRANPHLKNLKHVEAGTLILVPDMPGIEGAADVVDVGVTSDIVDRLRQALAGARSAVERSSTSRTRDIKATAALIKTREIQAVVKQFPELKDRFSEIADDLKASQKEVALLKTSNAADLAQLEKDLAEMNLNV